MIYLDACALVKFIKPDKETEALRSWREALPDDTELISSELALLEITRALLQARIARCHPSGHRRPVPRRADRLRLLRQ